MVTDWARTCTILGSLWQILDILCYNELNRALKERQIAMVQGEQWMTVQEAAEYLRVSRRTLYKYMEEGVLPFYVISSTGRRRLKRSDIDGLLISHTG